MNIRHGINLVLVAGSLLFTLQLHAQEYVVWSGGIGLDERETAPKDGTKLVFAAEEGKFVANVKVQVMDASGKKLVDTVSDGPWLILKLPAGRYSVQAQVNSAAQGGNIDVSEGNQEFAFKFTLGR
jgi:hypothetical protein